MTEASIRRVQCSNTRCSRVGVTVSVPDVLVAPGAVARPPLFCTACGFAVPEVTPRVPAFNGGAYG